MLPKKPLQTYNDGVCRIYTVTVGGAPGFRPTDNLVLKGVPVRYATRAVGISRFYAAKQAKERIDKVVRVPRQADVSVLDICAIEGKQYTVRQVQSPPDVLPPSTDLSLEAVEP